MKAENVTRETATLRASAAMSVRGCRSAPAEPHSHVGLLSSRASRIRRPAGGGDA